MRALLVAALVLAACGPTTLTIDHHGDPGVPAPRTDASSAYDNANGTIVMFGGADKSGVLGDTWTWDGAGWRRQHPATSPSAREFAWMAFDPATSRVVLFGGESCAPPATDEPIGCEYKKNPLELTDTWSWDGRTWSQVNTKHKPPIFSASGYFGSMTPDLGHGNLILATYGPPDPDFLIQSWTLEHGDWVRLHPKHSPVTWEFSGPAYDAVSGRVILQQESSPHIDYGPNSGPHLPPVGNSTWSWDGSDWQDLGPTVNSPHSYGQLVSVGRHGVLLIWEGSAYEWNGRTWAGAQQLPEAISPAMRPRNGWSAAYHEPTRELMLAGGRAGSGGNHLLADTAAWDGSSWTILVPAPPSPAIPLGPCSAKQAVSGYGFGPSTDPSGVTVEIDFFEPPSGSCHIHVDVILSIRDARGNQLKISGNPSTQPLDADLTWDAGGQAVTFTATGLCAFGSNLMAVIRAGDATTTEPIVLSGSCQMASPPPASITSSVRPTGLRP